MQLPKLNSATILTIGFLAIRLASFIYKESFVPEVLGGLLVVGFAAVALKNYQTAWYLLIAELLLDGAGHYFEFQSLLLRTWFLGIIGLAWMINTFVQKNFEFNFSKAIKISISVFGITLIAACVRGFLLKHNPTYVIQDTILYLFIFLVIPTSNTPQISSKKFLNLISGFIISTLLFTYTTFVLYSSKFLTLRDEYYHWFRNVASGKITDLGFNFYRVVLSEHLYLVPIILVAFSKLTHSIKNKTAWMIMIPSLLIMVTNFTRIYILAILIAALTLISQKNIRGWLRATATTSLVAGLLFFGTHIVASGGTSFGLELLGLRAYGVVKPETDVSSAIRKALLPDIFNTIKKHPLIGSGLGTTVSHIDPVTHEKQTRTQFDWGYFEMIAELGVLGTLTYLALLLTISAEFFIATKTETTGVARGLLAGAIALFVINITTPALFQGFGVLYFVFLYNLSRNPSKIIQD